MWLLFNFIIQMGNNQTAQYQFEDEFEIISRTDTYYELRKREDGNHYRGRVLESADKDHIR